MKCRDKILTIIGYSLAIFPYMVFGAYSAYCADSLVTDDNVGKELVLMGILLMMGGVFLYLHIIIHEAGHLLGGFLTGWQFLSFRVGNLVLLREDGKFRWKKTTIVGTGGQCLMAPPEVEADQVPFFLYLFGGGAANLLVSLPAALAGVWIKGFLGGILLVFSIIGTGLGVMNLFPTQLGGLPNDGYQLFVEIPGNKKAKKYLCCLMRINTILKEEESIKALPEKMRNTILDIPAEEASKSIEINLLLYKIAVLQEEERYEEAKEVCRKIVENPHAASIFKQEAGCELLYYEIMGECREEKIKQIYDKKLQKYIKATALYPSRKRLMYSYYLIYQRDEEAAQKEYQLLLKVAKTHPAKAESALECREAERVRKHYEAISTC